MSRSDGFLATIVTQVALALYLIVTGLCLFGVGSSISSEEINALTSIFKSAKVINYIIGALLIAYGIFLLVKTFMPGFDLGNLDNIIRLVAIILWILITVLSLYNNRADLAGGARILHWLLVLAKNAFIIGGLLLTNDR